MHLKSSTPMHAVIAKHHEKRGDKETTMYQYNNITMHFASCAAIVQTDVLTNKPQVSLLTHTSGGVAQVKGDLVRGGAASSHIQSTHNHFQI